MKMFKKLSGYILFVSSLVILIQGCNNNPATKIYIEYDTDMTVNLAAGEVRKYIYQRTGRANGGNSR